MSYEGVFYPKSFGTIFVWYVFTLGWTGDIVLRECKNRLAPKLPMWCLNKTIGVWVLKSVFADPNNTPNKINHATHIKYRIPNIYEHLCACVWVCVTLPFAKNICNAFHLIHSIYVGITLAQVDFCTLANNVSRSSKREHIPHKNGNKWFGIKHSFITCIIIYCSYMILKIICNFLGVNFFLTHMVYMFLHVYVATLEKKQ